MITLGQLHKKTKEFLLKTHPKEAPLLTEKLLSAFFNIERLDLYLQFEKPITEQEKDALRPLVQQAAKGVPLAYLVNKAPFFGRTFFVNEHVLIPRPETALLVEWILEDWKDTSEGVVFDLYTGSGNIGISLQLELPNLTVISSDLSKEALLVAQANQKQWKTTLSFLYGDGLTPFYGKKADLLVANPPYIAEEEFLTLDPSVRDYEPKLALTAEENGLLHYRHLAEKAKDYLNPDGALYLEIGYNQREAVQKLFANWSSVEIRKDFAGHPRMVKVLP